MTTNRHDRLERLFREANELEPSMRRAFLEQLPVEDRVELESLLAFDHPDDRIPVDGTPAQIAALLEGTVLRAHHPERIASYRILDVLGEGGMAVVYRAQQELTLRHVA